MTIDEFRQEGQPGSSACPGNLLTEEPFLVLSISCSVVNPSCHTGSPPQLP